MKTNPKAQIHNHLTCCMQYIFSNNFTWIYVLSVIWYELQTRKLLLMQYAVMKEIFLNPASPLHDRGHKTLQQQYINFFTLVIL